MLNRRGQSLVVFILMLPIILGIVILVVDVGGAMVMKNHMDNVNEMVMELSLDKDMKEEDILELLNYNLEGNNNQVSIGSDGIHISSDTYVKGIFSNMFGFKGFNVKSEYVGSVLDGKRKVDKKR